MLEGIHVIEYSAYEKLKEAYDALYKQAMSAIGQE
jgi:hypothetical protein